MAEIKDFDARQVDPSETFEALPAGRYIAAITDSEMKPTQSGTGRYLQLTFTILEGEYTNRLVWARLNLDNPNQTTVRIARSQLSAICHSIGVLSPRDSLELHNLPMQITVKVKKRKDTGELTNEVKGFDKKEAAQGQPQQARNGTAPWKR